MTLTKNEVIQLLQTAGAYDGRKAAEASVHAWSDAADRARWTYEEAAEAIKAHYAEFTVFIMPAHVTQRIKAARQDQAMRHPVDPPDPVGQRRLAELISGAFRTIPDDWRDDAMAQSCPSCKARPGEQCTRDSAEGRVATRIPHPSRMKAGEAAS